MIYILAKLVNFPLKNLVKLVNLHHKKVVKLVTETFDTWKGWQ